MVTPSSSVLFLFLQEKSIMPPSQIEPTTHVLIAGSRYASSQMLNYARRVVRRAHGKGYTILVGDNPKGVDMAVVVFFNVFGSW
jgi:hypothetical protein